VTGRLPAMPKRRHRHPVSSSELVQHVAEPSDEPVAWPAPVRDGVWTDTDGTVWRLRSNAGLRRIARLVRSPDVRVLLAYGPEGVTEVPPAEREDLWATALPYLEGRPGDAGSFTSYVVAEFRDDQRRVLVILEESC
jgi:hypothetical protein